MKEPIQPEKGPFLIYKNAGCVFYFLCILSLCFALPMIGLSFSLKEKGSFPLLAIISSAVVVLFGWLGRRQRDSGELLCVISDRGIEMKEDLLRGRWFIGWEYLASAEIRNTSRHTPYLELKCFDPSRPGEQKRFSSDFVNTRYNPEEVLEVIEAYRDFYWEKRKSKAPRRY